MTNTKRRTFTGPRSYSRDQRRIYCDLRSAYPDAELLHGQWCGSGWEYIEVGMRALAAGDLDAARRIVEAGRSYRGETHAPVHYVGTDEDGNRVTAEEC